MQPFTLSSVLNAYSVSRTVKGERQQGHNGIREVGNVTADKEITFKFQAREQDTQS